MGKMSLESESAAPLFANTLPIQRVGESDLAREILSSVVSPSRISECDWVIGGGSRVGWGRSVGERSRPARETLFSCLLVFLKREISLYS